MTKKYIITASSWIGEVEIMYSDDMLDIKDGNMLMVVLDVRHAELSERQHVWFLNNCREYASFESKIRSSPNVKITEDAIEVTFEMFWDRYNFKDPSSSIVSRKVWNKLKKSEQILAYSYIMKYDRVRESWCNKKNAETYLRQQLWNK